MSTLSIAIAGLGTVGSGVVELLRRNAALIESDCGRRLEIVAVCARDRNRRRGLDLSAFRWVDDACDLAGDPGVDVVVEPDRRRRRRGVQTREAHPGGGKAFRDGEQGAAGGSRDRTGNGRRQGGRACRIRGRGGRRHSDREGAARGIGGQQGDARLRDSQRHIKLHPDGHAGT